MTELTFSIIGVDGWATSERRLSKQHFEGMCMIANGLIDQFSENNYPITHLVSGGRAWAEHCATRLFLNKKVPNLRMYLPCEFKTYVHDTDTILNNCHKQFRIATDINSLSEIRIAKAYGAEFIDCKEGDIDRDAMISKSDFIMACTFGSEHLVQDVNTERMIKCYLDRVRRERMFDKSFHYDLNTGKIYIGSILPKKSSDID